jgi:hypothetical protein
MSCPAPALPPCPAPAILVLSQPVPKSSALPNGFGRAFEVQQSVSPLPDPRFQPNSPGLTTQQQFHATHFQASACSRASFEGGLTHVQLGAAWGLPFPVSPDRPTPTCPGQTCCSSKARVPSRYNPVGPLVFKPPRGSAPKRASPPRRAIDTPANTHRLAARRSLSSPALLRIYTRATS